MERRQEIRHILNREASFVWTDEKGVEYEAHGITRDISPHGMFINTEFLPPPNVVLEIDVVLSDGNSALRVPLGLKASALVVRVEPSMEPGLQGGFATVNKTFELVRGDAVDKNEWDYSKQ